MAKKKTVAELTKENGQLRKELKGRPEFSNILENNVFIGTQWEGKALESVQITARALLLNASALENLTELFSAQQLDVPMVSINADDVKVKGNIIKRND